MFEKALYQADDTLIILSYCQFIPVNNSVRTSLNIENPYLKHKFSGTNKVFN